MINKFTKHTTKDLYAFIAYISIGLMLFLSLSAVAGASSLHVGSGYTYSTPAAAINDAVSGDVVYIHSGTYIVSTMITVKSGVSLIGDGMNKTIIKASSTTAGNTSTYPALVYVSGASNLVISNMSVLGYYSDWSTQHSNSGHNNYGIGINIRGSSNNVVVHDVYMDMLTGDGVKVSGCTNTNLYNLRITTSGHDGVCFYATSYGYLNNSYIDLAINTGIRFDGASHCRVAQTTFIQSSSGTGAGYIELENALTNCTVTKCAFLTSSDPVVWFAYSDSGTVNIYNNIIYGAPAMVSSLSPYTGTFTNNTRYTTAYDWTAMGYGYDAASTGSGSLPVYNGTYLPVLISPSNGATLQTINGNQIFTWQDVNSTNYRVYLATDSGFTNLLQNYSVSSPSTSFALDNGTYYWRIKAYADSNGTWTTNTSTWSFTIDGNTLSKTGVYGVIYDTDTDNPIEGAVVTLVNGSWSSTYVTRDDGFYSFSVSKDSSNGSIYYLSASATNYIGSISSAGQGLPLNMTSDTYEENLALTKSPVYFNPHYVTFTVCAPWGTTYSNVTINVYKGTSNDIFLTGITDDFGRVAFKLEDDQVYKITCESEEQNIHVERTLTASDGSYSIWVYNAHKIGGFTDEENDVIVPQASDYMGYGVAAAENNITYGYINQTILSKTDDSVSYTTTITQINSTGATGNFSYTTSGSTTNESFAIEVPNNASYQVKTVLTHPSFTQTYNNVIDVKGYGINPSFDFGWEDAWNYEAAGLFLLLALGGLIGGKNIPAGIIGAIGIAYMNVYIGWWHPDITGQFMMALGSLIGISYLMVRGNQ